VKFTHTAGGLVAKDGPLKQFAIAGEDGKFAWADATIDGDSVVLQSAEVAVPIAVRYAWADNPVGCNLANRAGLPAAPFQAEAKNAPLITNGIDQQSKTSRP
jgi:sialate O-acetylesterase